MRISIRGLPHFIAHDEQRRVTWERLLRSSLQDELETEVRLSLEFSAKPPKNEGVEVELLSVLGGLNEGMILDLVQMYLRLACEEQGETLPAVRLITH